jgi:hypothetical protein
MDLTPAQKRKATIEAKRAKAEMAKLERKFAGVRIGRPTKEFNAKIVQQREAASVLQAAIRRTNTMGGLKPSDASFQDKVFKVKVELEQNILDCNRELKNAEAEDYDEYDIRALKIAINFSKKALIELDKKIKSTNGSFNLSPYTANLDDIWKYVVGDFANAAEQQKANDKYGYL